jgi:acetolactate synthase-1/3 small subunit
MVIELIGTQSKLEAFIELMEDYEILELARTGVTGLSRGTDDVKILE